MTSSYSLYITRILHILYLEVLEAISTPLPIPIMEAVIPNETTGTAGTIINTTANTTVISAADTTINTTVSQGPSAPTIIFHTTSVSLMTSTTSATRLVQSSQGVLCENVIILPIVVILHCFIHIS